MKYSLSGYLSGIILLCTSIFGMKEAFAQDVTNLGGELTTFDNPKIALQVPSPNIASSERFDRHLEGQRIFHTPLDQIYPDKEKVIGPRFNASTCGECHFNNGKGAIRFLPGGFGSTMLLKVSLKGLNPDGTTRDIPGTPEQIQDHQVSGRSPYKIYHRYTYIKGRYPDGKEYELRKPRVTFKIPGVKRKQVVSSLRMSPSIIGMGLLEAVPLETLLKMADPADLDRDGISGKINLVFDIASGTKKAGRFGFKASHPSVLQQSAAALFHDMGVTNSLFNNTNDEPEMSDEDLAKVLFFQQVSAIHTARNQDLPEVQAGKEIFQRINCSACHVMTLKTGPSEIPEIALQEFHPFTDLLLHDMGPGLADKRAEFFAQGSEWRTTPLWGLGITKQLARHKTGFLHDGRARSIEEAILWHDGEAKRSKKAFMKLKFEDRKNLVEFLKSL